jgi:hypothetical protein
MNEYNAFLDEWKSIRTTQETILRLLEEQEEKNSEKGRKKLLLLSGAILGLVLIVGIFLGFYFNTKLQIKSVSYAVSSEPGCLAMNGKWQETDKICYFMAQK